MIKFELIENTKEFKYSDRFEIKEGCTTKQNWQEPKIIKSFDDKEEALQALKSYKSSVAISGNIITVTEFYVAENEYDDEGILMDGGDIWEFSKISIDVVSKEGYNILAHASSIEEAEKMQEEIFDKDETETFLSFA